MYSWGHTWDKIYQVRYATGDTPFGPWEEGMVRPILVANEKEDRITSTGHHSVLNFNGKDELENTENGSPIVIKKNVNARFIRVSMPNIEGSPRPGIWEIKLY